MIEDIKEFLEDVYEIKGSITGDMCVFEFPKRSELPERRAFRNCYEVEYEDGIARVSYTRWSDKDKILSNVIYLLPDYAYKVFVWCDLVRCSLSLKYNFELIKYEVDEAEADEDSFFQCLPAPLYDPEFEEKAEKLETLFLTSYDKIYEDFEEEADTLGIGDGFRMICNIFLEAR